LSGNTVLSDEDLRAIDELRDELVAAIRRRKGELAELHGKGLMGNFYTDRAVHERVERLLADIIREFEDMGFPFDPYMAAGVLKKLGRDWLSHALEHIVV